MNTHNTFGLFSNRVIELCNHAFSPMYRRVFKKYWDNAFFARMRRAYFHSNIKDGYYEMYLPTFEDIEQNMKYYRVVIQVVPELDNQMLRPEAEKLHVKQVSPAGVIDSELICLVAPTRTKRGRQERQFLRGVRTRTGYMIGAFLGSLPESVVNRILKVITGFLKKRLQAFLDSFHLTPQLQRRHNPNTLYYSTVSYIIEEISLSLANAVRCISHAFHWLIGKIGHIYQEVGRQNQMRKAFSRIRELKGLLREISNIPDYMRDGFNPTIMKPLTQLLGVSHG